MISQDWLQDFANPPAGHRPMPLWVWNGRVTAAGITERLEQVAAAGMGGVFVHPRAGLVTEYLSPEWFDLWGHALKECERLGLECHIYDENSYPSGFAGGHVVANHPNLAATRLVAIKADSPFNPLPPWPEQPPIAAFRLSPEDAVLGTAGHEDMKKASPRHPILICRLEQEPARDWNAGFPYVDLTRAEATDAFIEATHQRYRAAFSPAFGRTIKYAFTDEPTLKRTRGLPVSRRFLRDFLAAYGYPLEECLAALFVDTPNAPAVRFDVYRLLDRRFTGNYARKLHDWCEQHGLKFTGHVNEHSWPQPDDVPCNMSFLRWMQVPGNDLLGFQFSPASLEANAIYLMNLKELSSVASQLGRERVIAESCGGGGYSMAPRDFKPLEDFLLVHGVNLINPHLSHQTLSGARKHDWAQTLSDHSPWWAVSKPHQDHVARCATALLRGREKNRVLVLQPDSTAWVQHRHDLDAEVVENSELTTGKAGQREMPLATLRAGQQRMVLALTRRQVDFDLGCEQILEELGSVAGARLRCGERDYDLFVLPAVTTNLFSSTVALLRAFLAAGGLVVSGQTLPRFVDGRPSGDVVTLRETFANQWHLAESTDELANRAASLVPPRVCVTRASHPDLLCRRHELPDGSTLFLFANPWDIPFSGEVKIEGHGLIRLDTGTGAAAPFPSRAASGNQQTVELNLSRRGHLLLISTPDSGRASTAPSPRWREVTAGSPRISRLEPNRLLVDYCDLHANGADHPGISTYKADWINWKAQGWAQNPWCFSIQYKQAFMDVRPAPDSGFRVRYRFTFHGGKASRKDLRLAVERPDVYRIALNGIPLDPSAATRWFDEEMRAFPIGEIVRDGVNVVELVASPFHPLCEIAPIYVLGDFALRPAEAGFDIVDASPLSPGDWTRQGLPFYPGWLRYDFDFALDAPCAALELSLPEWAGSAVRFAVDGRMRGTLLHEPFVGVVHGSLSAGTHRLGIEIAGHLKNQMGPHFSDGLPLPGSWEMGPCPQPAGRDYKFLPSGLTRIGLRATHQAIC